MTSRDRPGPDSGTSSSKAAGAEGGSVRAATVAPCDVPPPSLWEAWYSAASAEQRKQLLDQARQQGLLFAHQLPAPEPQPPSSQASLTLHSQLTAAAPELPRVVEPPFAPLDGDLDEVQRQAVARALATPDLSLILGYPGTGKSRVLAELARQALARGWRILLAAPDAPAVDRVLEVLDQQGQGERLLRWLGEQESLACLPPCAAALSLPGRLHHFQHHTLPAARRAAQECWAAVERCRRQAEAWGQLEKLAPQAARLEQDHAALLREEADLPTTLAAELNGACPAGDEPGVRELAAIQERLAAVHDEAERLEAEHRYCCEQKEQLAPLVEAKESHRWWTGAWWRATMTQLAAGAPRSRLQDLAARCQQVDDRQQELARELADLQSRAAEIQATLTRQREQLFSDELTRRRAALAARLGEVSRAREQAAAALRQALAQLELTSAEFTPEALAQGRADAAARLAQAEESARQRQDWLAAVEAASCPSLAAEFLGDARLVAATVTGLPAGPSPALLDFDLVILDEAHRASEADLRSLAERGRRLVLVGEAGPDLPVAPPPRSRGRSPHAGGSRDEVGQSLPPFSRLWDRLHPDPRRLPGRCRQADGRLVISLRPVPAEQRGWLQREPVFDRPEIELGIFAAPGSEPSLAEVAFPGGTPIGDARAFIHRELQELPVHASGPQPRWRESELAWSIDLSLGGEGESAVVSLGDGVREYLGRCACHACPGDFSWQTLSLEFDKSAGWDRPRAEAWVEEHLRLRDTGRTIVLARGQRFRPALARHLSAMLYGGALQPVRESASQAAWPSSRPALQFYPVPAQARGGSEAPAALAQTGRRGSDPALRWNGSGPATATATLTSPARGPSRPGRGGAGLEVDLSDPRRVDALPAELRPELPARGVVNYLEARAVVQTLEEVVADPELQAAWSAWRPARGPAVAVMSLFPAQVELLRVLVRRSGVLSGSPLPVEVCQPRQLAHREALVVLLGLTRSHATRAVPFSEHPRELLLALTRAVGRLLIFGDVGTMSRRGQWFGVLDHQDATTGPLEQALLSQLLASLPEHEVTAPQPCAYAGT